MNVSPKFFSKMRGNDFEDNIFNASASKYDCSANLQEQIIMPDQATSLDKYPNGKSLPEVSTANIFESKNKQINLAKSKIKMTKNQELKHTKYPKRANLANRSDVLNKMSIRKLRRHFWSMFRLNNK